MNDTRKVGMKCAKAARVVAFLFIFFLCKRSWAADAPMSGYEERRRAASALMEAATVWIVTDDDDSIGNGSGFLVGKGYVMTNAHVVENIGKNGKIYVLNEVIPLREAKIVSIARDDSDEDEIGGHDFALLRFTPPSGVNLPTLSFNLDVKRMDRVSAWGYPVMVTRFDKSTKELREGNSRNLTPAPVVYTEGTVSAIVTSGLGNAIIHTAAISGGNSGGPLVNGRGEVVGINTWGYTEEDEGAFRNMSIMANDIAAFLHDNGVEPQLAPGQKYTARPPVSRGGPVRAPKPPRENRTREADSFTVNVPVGWSVLDEDKDMILVGADDESAAVGIIVASNNGKSLARVAKTYASELGADDEPVLDDDIYQFGFTDDGVETMVFVGESNDDDRHVMIFVSGDGENKGVKEVLNSIEDK